MAVPRITMGEITRLARKLERLDPPLNESDRAVLCAVFDLAAAALSETAPRAGSGARPGSAIARTPAAPPERMGQGGPPSLSEGFKDAFQPGAAAFFTLDNRTPADNASQRPAIKVRLV